MFPPKRSEHELYVDLNFDVLYEDGCLLVVDKPAPLPVHRVSRFVEKNLLSLVEKRFSAEESGSLHVVNRLDSETSGLVLIAKSKESAAYLKRQFQNREVDKEYAAIVFGVPEEKRGRITTPLGSNVQNTFHLTVPDINGQKAETHFEVIQAWQDYAQLCIKPLTGRTHQIRAHLASIGHPIVGDKIYIDASIYERYVQVGWQEDMLDKMKLSRLALHATRLEFQHPKDKKKMVFQSDFPEILKQFLRFLP